MQILLLEDDPVLSDVIADYLSQYYSVLCAFSSDSAIELIDLQHFDLYIFDINIPGKNGIELLQSLRDFNDTTPTIIITAYTDLDRLTKSFDAKAHDFMRKPFDLEELKVRIESIRRIFHIEQESSITISSSISYNPDLHTLYIDDHTETLSPKESALLSYFINNAQRVISSEELMQNLWEFDMQPSDATLRSHIRRLREMVGKESICTIRGAGYMWNTKTTQ